MKKIIKFGEVVEGYKIPVLNEREIRAAAGIIFILMFVSALVVILQGNFLLLKYAVTIFLTDLLIRVLINPQFSPSMIIGRMIVRNQVPEYVGAEQKKYAWIIGAVLAAAIFIHLIIVNAYSPITGIICLICLLFLFFETAFGICIGCKLYRMFNKKSAEYCPGEVCSNEIRKKTQKISKRQIYVIIGFTVYIFLAVYLFNDVFSKKPVKLFSSEVSSTITNINLKETK